jgi:hypothetical protein
MGTERVVHKSEYGSRANCCCRRHARGQKEKAGKARQEWGLHRGCCDDERSTHAHASALTHRVVLAGHHGSEYG